MRSSAMRTTLFFGAHQPLLLLLLVVGTNPSASSAFVVRPPQSAFPTARTTTTRKLLLRRIPACRQSSRCFASRAVVGEETVPSPTTSLVGRSKGDASGEAALSSSVALATTPLPTNPNLQSDAAAATASYQRGLATIAFITLLFASNSPALHAAFSLTNSSHPPPILLINAACSAVALAAMVAVGPFLDRAIVDETDADDNADDTTQPSSTSQKTIEVSSSSGVREERKENKNTFLSALLPNMSQQQQQQTLQAGLELGTWKMLGTLLNILGLSLTSAGHGAFLIQLTTLLVPLAQGVMGVPIPQRIWTAIGLALTGVFLFVTQDTGGAADASLAGDLACVATAVLYATYDLRLFYWAGQRKVAPLPLITTKIVTQTLLSVAVLVAFAAEPSLDFVRQAAGTADLAVVAGVVLWSGLAVNALAPLLQVRGQQAVGPARAQILYASQPLWAALMSFGLLGERVGTTGLVGGAAFLVAMMLAATAELPDPDCGGDICEV